MGSAPGAQKDGLSRILSFSAMSSENLLAFPALRYSPLKSLMLIGKFGLTGGTWSGLAFPGCCMNTVRAEAAHEGKAGGRAVTQRRLSPPPSSLGFPIQAMTIAAQLAKMPLVSRREPARAVTALFSSDIPFSSA